MRYYPTKHQRNRYKGNRENRLKIVEARHAAAEQRVRQQQATIDTHVVEEASIGVFERLCDCIVAVVVVVVSIAVFTVLGLFHDKSDRNP